MINNYAHLMIHIGIMMLGSLLVVILFVISTSRIVEDIIKSIEGYYRF